MSGSIDLRAGDCVDVMRSLEDASVDAVVTDPPYGLEFMGKEWDRLGDVGKMSHAGPSERAEAGDIHGRLRVAYSGSANLKCGRCRKWKWDHEGRKCECGPLAEWPNVKAVEGQRMQEWHRNWATEALRVLKPGGHAVVFGGTRTYHRMVCGLEDAGFEIRDQLAWMFGSGFPKSLDVSKAIDAAAGAEREVVGPKMRPDGKTMLEARSATDERNTGWDRPSKHDPEWVIRNGMVTAPATDAARRWQGWGTALKPGYEPVVLARKPLSGTVAANVLEHGVGALNVDGCRIGTEVLPGQPRGQSVATDFASGGFTDERLGRWPANVVLDPDAAAMLDEQSGELTSGNRAAGEYGRLGGDGRYSTWDKGPMPEVNGDSGGASRFFYCAKVDSAERNAGLSVPSLFSQDGPDRNVHPTVKPVDLMRWLCRLVTPPDGVILDPFMGSGSTGIAAYLEGFSFVGVEREPEYMEIARARIAHWSAQEVEVVA